LTAVRSQTGVDQWPLDMCLSGYGIAANNSVSCLAMVNLNNDLGSAVMGSTDCTSQSGGDWS
jgi:hypothetical protein